MTRDTRPSEFGGFPGEIQPPPHELTAAEQLRAKYKAGHDGDDPDVILAEEHARDGYKGEGSL